MNKKERVKTTAVIKNELEISPIYFQTESLKNYQYTSTFKFPEVLARLVGASPFTILFNFNDWKETKHILVKTSFIGFLSVSLSVDP